MPFIENYDEFKRRQGCEPILARNRFLFPNGAQSDKQRHSDPPSDPGALAQLQEEYWRARLKADVTQYNQIRHAVHEQLNFHASNVGPLPEEGWEECLTKLKSQIEEAQAHLDKLTAKSPQQQEWDERRASMQRSQQRTTAMRDRLKQFPSFGS